MNPKGPNLAPLLSDLQRAAGIVRLRLEIVHATNEQELESLLQEIVQLRAGALVIGVDTFFNSQSARLAELALRHAIPAMYQYREFVAAGGLISYGGSITDAYRVAGTYVGRILKEKNPPSFRFSSPPRPSCSSTSEPPRCSALKCRLPCSCAPTR